LWSLRSQTPRPWNPERNKGSDARIALTVGLERKISDGDTCDAQHFASGLYADLIVYDDRGFGETGRLVLNTPVAIVTFEEFVRDQLGLSCLGPP
jgi:hypothetical protein